MQLTQKPGKIAIKTWIKVLFICLAIDGDDFVAQSYAFLLAGFETTSSTMTFALYELALHPAIQDRLRTEIVQVMEKYNQVLTYEAMQDMPYLDMVISGECHGYLPHIPGLCTTNSRNVLQLSSLQRPWENIL